MTVHVKCAVFTISDRCSAGVNLDTSGPFLVEALKQTFSNAQVFSKILPDEKEIISQTLINYTDEIQMNIIITTGGTGFSPRDVTPEATKAIIDREANGIIIAMASKSLEITPMAMLSRAAAGIRGKTLIINLPGSLKACKECFAVIKPILTHAINLVNNSTTEVESQHLTMSNETSFPHNHCKHNKSSQINISKVALRERESPYPMTEVNEALRMIEQQIKKLRNIKKKITNLSDCFGHVLAEDIRAREPLPPFRASIKDGYACRFEDGAGVRQVRSAVGAGDMPTHTLELGECVRINTGAPVPDGADCVVQVEDTRLISSSEDGMIELSVEILVAPKLMQDIRPIGHDIKQGQVVIKEGAFLDAANVGILATVGVIKVPVYAEPTIAILSTGNELQSPDTEVLAPGHVRDSNKIMLMNLLREHGSTPIDMGISKDDPTSTFIALENAFKKADIVITTGSVSMGDRDMLKPVLRQDFGAVIHFGRVNMKPGKPTTFATCLYDNKTKYIFALPGNPVSAYVTCLLFVIPMLNIWIGYEKRWPEIRVELGNEVKLDPRPEYARVTLTFTQDSLPKAFLTGNQCSSRLLSACGAPALICLPSSKDGPESLQSGTQLTALLTSRIRNQ